MFKAKLNVNLEGFIAPDYVSESNLPAPAPIPGQAYVPVRSYTFSEVPPETLSDMCDAFRKEVFKKAGVRDPKVVQLERVALKNSAAVNALKLIEFVESQRDKQTTETVFNSATKEGFIAGYKIVGPHARVVLADNKAAPAITMLFPIK